MNWNGDILDFKCENENGDENHIFHMKITVVTILTELLVSIPFHTENDDMRIMHLSKIKSNWDTIYV